MDSKEWMMGAEDRKGRQLPSGASHTMHFAPYLTGVSIHPHINHSREKHRYLLLHAKELRPRDFGKSAQGHSTLRTKLELTSSKPDSRAWTLSVSLGFPARGTEAP